MLRWFFLFFAVLAVGLGLLTQVRAPEWAPWKLALLAGEYGHWIALLPVGVGVLAWRVRGEALGPAVACVLLCALAVGLLVTPALEAWKIGAGLPGRMAGRIGITPPEREPFSLAGFFRGAPAPVAVETMVFETGQKLSLDFYRAAGSAKVPCVIVVHGGGWDNGTREEIAHFNHWLARTGYAVAAIDYRLAPKAVWPAQRDDVLAAIAFLKANAARLGIDATKLVLFGRSAGGNIAESVGYGASDPAIRGVIAFYAPADLHFAYQFGTEDDILKSPLLIRQFVGGGPEKARAGFDSASPYFHVTPKCPPTLLMHGALDTLVWHKQSERLDVRLTENNVPHVFVSLPWATHAFEYNLNGPGGQLATYAVEWFLASVTAEAAADTKAKVK